MRPDRTESARRPVCSKPDRTAGRAEGVHEAGQNGIGVPKGEPSRQISTGVRGKDREPAKTFQPRAVVALGRL
jgi:hypothetical protein